MAATAQGIGVILSKNFPSNEQGVRPLRAMKDDKRNIWVYVSDPAIRKSGELSTRLLASAADFLREKGYSVDKLEGVDLSFIVY